jgi:3-oxoacyl-[acyl-carrier protein] reductase
MRMSDLKGKVAIVTGASGGFGAGSVRALGAAGAAVAVNCATSRTCAEDVVASIVAAGGRATATQADVSSEGVGPDQ